MWRSRMFRRLFGTSGLLLLIAIGLLGVVIVKREERYFLQQIEDNLRSKAILVREVIRDRPARGARLQRWVQKLGKEINTRITLIAADGLVLADSSKNPCDMENHGDRPEVRTARAEGFGSATRFSNTLNQSMMYVALVHSETGAASPVVRVALPLDRIEGQLADLHRIVWMATAVTGVAAMFLAFWLARRITQPLQELTRGAERIAAGKFGHKVYVTEAGEVGALAQTFNSMSTNLSAQFTQLEHERQQLLAILSGMIEGVVALDAEQRILFVNDRAAQLLEFPRQTAAGRKLWEIVRQPALHEIVHRAIASSGPYVEEIHWTGPTPKILTVHAARLAGVPARGIILVLHDTTELRRLERLRQEFVANVSHELKTPLSVIKACIETLLDGAMDDPLHRGPFMDRIADQAERLHRLILDMLSLARIESESEVFEFQPVPLAPVVAACLERHRARAEAKHQHLEAQFPPSGEPSVAVTPRASVTSQSLTPSSSFTGTPSAGLVAWADEEAVGQILDNLVDNAIKYTPSGGHISVRCRLDDSRICLEVHDTGIGIAEADMPRIFERFYRVDKARSRELGGTGLGLAIVKHLVGAMHGSLRAASKPGQGTTFSILLPCAFEALPKE
jgi:two-component system phosphate regulon sensor histidine kinase PhoR